MIQRFLIEISSRAHDFQRRVIDRAPGRHWKPVLPSTREPDRCTRPQQETRMLTRKLFLRHMGGGCMTLVFAGCGGGGGDDDPEPPPPVTCSNFLFSNNHGHALV